MKVQVDPQHKSINVFVSGENVEVEFDKDGRAEVSDAVGEVLQRLSGAKDVSEESKQVDLVKLEANVTKAQTALDVAQTALVEKPDDAKAQKAVEKAQKALETAQTVFDAAKADGAGE